MTGRNPTQAGAAAPETGMLRVPELNDPQEPLSENMQMFLVGDFLAVMAFQGEGCLGYH